MPYTKEDLKGIEIFKNKQINTLLDPLTKTLNKLSIIELSKSLIDAKKPLSFFIVDIDNFKYVNDKYGHQIGDDVLTELANRAIQTVGSTGVVGRFGGDEFILIFFDSYE